MTGVAERLASYACDPWPELTAQLPRDVMRLSLFDLLTVAYAGRDEPVARAIRAVEREQSAPGASSIIGADLRLTARAAAMVNGTTAHALDYDDTHFAHIGHVSTVVLPPLLALAEGERAGGAALLDAALRGAEASIRVGLWLGRAHYEAGFHQTATAGIFGAVVGAAALTQQPHRIVAQAVALAASRASGLKAQFGTMAKPYHAGMAAAAALEVLSAARHGIDANPAALDGPFGLAATHGGVAEATAFAGRESLFPRISHKLYACCHGTHAAIEALSDLRGEDAVSQVEIAVHPRWLDVCHIRKPQTRLEAKFSLTLTGAMALRGLPLTRDSAFEAEVILAPELTALRDRVQVRGDPALSDTQSRVAVSGPGGRREATHDLAVPAAFDTRAEKLRVKSRDLIGADRAGRLWSAVMQPEGPVATDLMACLK